ncbi:MAG: putative phage abortive infection protein [Methylobacter sp.]|nr:putative phage abortive infection protein [Methylobacter sp.]
MAELVECKTCTNKGDPNMKTCPNCGGELTLIKTGIDRIIDTMTPVKLAKRLLWLGIGAFISMLLVLLFYWGHFGDLSSNPKDWGEFGGYFGGTLSPVLSFLSLIALLFTIVLQSKELELTRDELKRSADAQAATKNILDKQSETLVRQQFESTFFSLLDQHNKVLDSLTSPRAGKRVTVLSEAIEDILEPEGVDLDLANRILKSKNHHCGHYFRVLYQLLKFVFTNIHDSTITRVFDADHIKNDKLSDSEKTYTNIVRAFLGFEITQLLSINCFCKDSDDAYWLYKRLLERYSFLEHMPFNTIDENNEIFQKVLEEALISYDVRVFGDNAYVDWYYTNVMMQQKAR